MGSFSSSCTVGDSGVGMSVLGSSFWEMVSTDRLRGTDFSCSRGTVSSDKSVSFSGGLVDLEVRVELPNEHWVDWFFQIQKLPSVELEHFEASKSFSVEDLKVYLFGWRIVSLSEVSFKMELSVKAIEDLDSC
ncbi:uncharacterized protein G2W53_010209 [Senna tora]|uniref:Uncharacterized protein n=1 Tax=Senna tora TaxID=362788 RepID=A0A835CB94_9FABA|nr:uncharacterized protein G2W53_010209 [Senna tora]